MTRRSGRSPAIASEIRAAVVADLRNSGDTAKVVAKRHGVNASTISTWVDAESDIGLPPGRWVNDRGVMRFEPRGVA